MTKFPKFQIYLDNAGEYRFRLLSVNGQNILHASEGYTRKQSCKDGIESVKTNAPFDERYERKQAINGQYYFVLKARNGEPIGMSEMYTRVANRENGINAVKRDAPSAGTEDLTATTNF